MIIALPLHFTNLRNQQSTTPWSYTTNVRRKTPWARKFTRWAKTWSQSKPPRKITIWSRTPKKWKEELLSWLVRIPLNKENLFSRDWQKERKEQRQSWALLWSNNQTVSIACYKQVKLRQLKLEEHLWCCPQEVLRKEHLTLRLLLKSINKRTIISKTK